MTSKFDYDGEARGLFPIIIGHVDRLNIVWYDKFDSCNQTHLDESSFSDYFAMSFIAQFDFSVLIAV